jgi:acyl-lipid omega-6 desaturase (Delta-12 desaturase)
VLHADAPIAAPARDRFAHLRNVKLGQVRKAFSPQAYERSTGRALLWLAVDGAAYLLLVCGALFAPHPLLQLLFGVFAGVAVASLFVWGHDAAHGALFRSTRFAEVLGTAAMLPSLNMYRLWVYGHNRVHHGFTSYSPIDWIWRPDTPTEYGARRPLSRLVYRIERSLAGCGLHYVLRVWWPGMVRFRPEPELRRRYRFGISKLVTALFVVAASTLAWVLGGGPIGVVAAVLVPWVVFNYHIALFIYLHHTHPSLPFFDDRQEWSATIGQVGCSTVIRGNRVFEAVTHNILVHTPHHVDARIPFYRLPRAWDDLRSDYGGDVVTYRFRLSTVREIFRTCQLFDFRTQRWSRFADRSDGAL